MKRIKVSVRPPKPKIKLAIKFPKIKGVINPTKIKTNA